MNLGALIVLLQSAALPIGGSVNFSEIRAVGSCLVVGIDGTRLDSTTQMALTQGKIAGIILMRSNIKSLGQAKRLCLAAREAARRGGRPLPLICVDQEGGKVSRLSGLEGFPHAPSAASLRKSGPLIAYQTSLRVALYMRRAGLNVDLAPDLDLSSGSGVIGTRSFGTDPRVVARTASSVLNAFNSAGVATIVKHFPGHGLTGQDSHLALPSIATTPQRLAFHEQPFRDVIAHNPSGAMLGHLLVPSVDRRYPASLSQPFASRLRQIIGPDRLIFTDDGTMSALSSYGDQASRAARAFSVGVDIYLTTSTFQGLGKNFNLRVGKRISAHRVSNAGAMRVLRWRKRLAF